MKRLRSEIFARMYVDARALEKIWTLPDNAYRLYWDAIMWSREKLTDGRIPKSMITAISPATKPKQAAALLVSRGLWEHADTLTEDAWLIHDYADYQETLEEVAARSLAASVAGAKGAHARWHANGKGHA
jgi:hypothetical protein